MIPILGNMTSDYDGELIFHELWINNNTINFFQAHCNFWKVLSSPEVDFSGIRIELEMSRYPEISPPGQFSTVHWS